MSNWNDRIYGDDHAEAIPRDDLVQWVIHRVLDGIEFGEWIYNAMISQSPEPFDGTIEWFDKAFEEQWVLRPRRNRWPKGFVGQALTVTNGHTNERFVEWLDSKRTDRGITFQSYVRWLRDRHNVQWAPRLGQTDRSRMSSRVRSHKSSVR